MEMDKMNIQWYPGHMTKTRRQIEADLKQVDAVCEIVDARIPMSSRNPDIDAICGSKPRIIVLNRMDLARLVSLHRLCDNVRSTRAIIPRLSVKGPHVFIDIVSCNYHKSRKRKSCV